MAVVQDAYEKHGLGRTTNPDSYFLSFPDLPRSRIIALPARVETPDSTDLAGIKWIGSFPQNVEHGIPRASAVLVLNDMTTGYPFALLEASGISAARTAASAAVTARAVATTLPPDGRLGVIGAGVIARAVVDYLLAVDYGCTTVLVHDPDPDSATHLVRHASAAGVAARTASLREVLDCQTVVTATTALEPYIDRGPEAGQLYLNISLRDFVPQALAGAQNVLDDVDHCLKANTSPHLLEQLLGHRGFVTGTIPELLAGKLCLSPDRGVVVSPFGLGLLDLAVGHWVYTHAEAGGGALPVPDFFGDLRRW
jgi:2,3-diaminopropionate biosynthesis protein SbnB